MSVAATLSDLEKGLIDQYQRGLPLVSRPYAAMAETLGATEDAVIQALVNLQKNGVLSRLGAVVTPHRAGWSTLAAVSAPKDRVAEVAAVINDFPTVNHNYERDHHYNIWFVVAGSDKASVFETLRAIEGRTGLKVLDLPMEEAFHIDLGFKVTWS
ncbi:MAG: Lrp/AsnC family transcriptional regulator [Alphaproteobacteria bacterium]|nr:Lrp/AsnC family transcriptional regulator [Alphaproteobacteria bacterium]MBF0249112.1 Lrp/AsnC family transcriptional regulator [Alphaproteobacteria bacterium]